MLRDRHHAPGFEPRGLQTNVLQAMRSRQVYAVPGASGPHAGDCGATQIDYQRDAFLSVIMGRLRYAIDTRPGKTLITGSARVGSSKVRENRNSAPISIVKRAPLTASCSLVSPHRKRTKSSPSLFRSTEGRRSPESGTSFRSSEEPHAGLTAVVAGWLR